MASREISVEKCKVQGVELLIYTPLRTLEEQAKLYRQSRTISQIEKKIIELNKNGFSFLADILKGVGPQNGPHTTNAAPGEPWHNYGSAFDTIPLLNGQVTWRVDKIEVTWNVYGQAAVSVGLEWGGNWPKI